MRHEFAGLRHGRKRGLFSRPLPIELLGSSVGHRHSVRGAGHLQPAAESYGERNNERHHRSFRPRDISLRQRQCDGFKRVPIALTEAWTRSEELNITAAALVFGLLEPTTDR